MIIISIVSIYDKFHIPHYLTELEEKEWVEFCNIIKDKKTGLKTWWD